MDENTAERLKLIEGGKNLSVEEAVQELLGVADELLLDSGGKPRPPEAHGGAYMDRWRFARLRNALTFSLNRLELYRAWHLGNRRQIKQLREALAPFAKLAHDTDPDIARIADTCPVSWQYDMYGTQELTAGDLRRASRAFTETEPPKELTK